MGVPVLLCAVHAVHLLGRRHQRRVLASLARQPSTGPSSGKPELDTRNELPRTHGRAELLDDHQDRAELAEPSGPIAELDDTSMNEKKSMKEIRV